MGDQTPGRVGARRLVGAAGLGVLVSGLIVNVYLAVVARALPPAEYATFGSFWALALVVGFGAFLPLEQELARRLPLPGDRQALLRAASGAAAVLAGIALVVLVGALPIIWRSLDGDVSVLLALGALCVVSAGQFLVRGTLIGTDRLVRHAAVMVLDAVLRLGFAVGVFIVGGADAAAFCWALVAAIVLAHLPQLPAAWRRAVAWERPLSPGARADRPSVRGLTRAAMPLLVGSVCAQLLLNGLPVLVVAEAGEANEAAAGVFVAAFTLAKAPLSMVVPLQSAVVPTLTRLIAADRRREVVVLLVKGVALLGAVAAIGVPLAFFVGPWVVSLVFGADYTIGGLDLAIILCGVLAHIGLVVVTQVHVARGRHRDVALSWTAGLLTAGVTFWLVPGVILSGEVAFGVGSAVGAVVSALILAASRRRPAEERNEA
ncbi:lipopolysaccharide biosynthesis protein [Actinomycetospora sp. NBC_00405]|uniref:lipopolysaccharide biosynthesis protein n=1 Tax=Actinomycetospora sp. NBC_00405 TaxID=2975952 RepID=UPI002E1B951D